MNTTVVPEKEVTSQLDAAIKKSLVICFPQHTDVFSKTRAWHGSGPAFSVIIEKDNRVIAHAGSVDRTILIGEKQYRISGIQNVFVLPEFRGTGLSDAVLKTAMQQAQKQGFHLGLLFTDEKTKKVYARNGWIQISGQKFVRIENDQPLELTEDKIKMFYPLKQKTFPKGTVNLQANDW